MKNKPHTFRLVSPLFPYLYRKHEYGEPEDISSQELLLQPYPCGTDIHFYNPLFHKDYRSDITTYLVRISNLLIKISYSQKTVIKR